MGRQYSRPVSVRVAVLGSTGSIGTQALDAIGHLDAAGFDFEVVALVAGRNRALLAEQAAAWPGATAGLVADDGPGVLCDVARRADVDSVVHAVSGAAGVAASFAAAEAGGRRLCLANKESLVVGGTLLTALARENGCEIVPVDSEHSAIFQAMRAGRRRDVRRVILTASGGPFRDAGEWPAERLAGATVEQALDHPTWDMGGRVTVGSATLFNKALELIEAVRLFDLRADEVEVVVHPQSVVHSMVEYADGSTIAQLAPPDMRGPIGYALTHPRRGACGAAGMDWSRATSLTFGPPDEGRFPALGLARRALAEGGAMPAVLNAADEVATGAFLDGRLAFGRIAGVVEATMDATAAREGGTLEELLEADAGARGVARGVIAG